MQDQDGQNNNKIREKCRLRVFDNRILRRIFRPKGNDIEWRRLHNEEPHSLYRSSVIKVRVIKFKILRLIGHLVRMEEGRSAFKGTKSAGSRKSRYGNYFHIGFFSKRMT